MAAGFFAKILYFYASLRINNRKFLQSKAFLSASHAQMAKFRFPTVLLYHTTLSGKNQLYFAIFLANLEELSVLIKTFCMSPPFFEHSQQSYRGGQRNRIFSSSNSQHFSKYSPFLLALLANSSQFLSGFPLFLQSHFQVWLQNEIATVNCFSLVHIFEFLGLQSCIFPGPAFHSGSGNCHCVRHGVSF